MSKEKTMSEKTMEERYAVLETICPNTQPWVRQRLEMAFDAGVVRGLRNHGDDFNFAVRMQTAFQNGAAAHNAELTEKLKIAMTAVQELREIDKALESWAEGYETIPQTMKELKAKLKEIDAAFEAIGGKDGK